MKISGLKVFQMNTRCCTKKRKAKQYGTAKHWLRKEADLAVSRSVTVPNRTSNGFLYMVGEQAVWLAKCNRRGCITGREVQSAVRMLRPRGYAGNEGA